MHGQHNPNAGNPKGSFEDVNWITITSKFRQEVKKGLPRMAVANKYVPRIKEIVANRSQEPLWGFKSALTHHMLDVILPLVPNPHLVYVFRNLLHNAQSYVVHQKDNYGRKISLEEAFATVNESNTTLVNTISVRAPKLFTSYEDIKKQPADEAKKMAQFLGVKFTPKIADEIREFIMPGYSTLKK